MALCGWTWVRFDRDRELSYSSQKSIITSSDQFLQLLFLFSYLYPPRSPLTPTARLSVTVKKSFNMPAFVNHSNLFPLGAWNAFSVYMPAFNLTLIVHSCLLFTCHCSLTLCVRPTSNDTCGLWQEGYELLNKGNAAKMGKFWTLLMWFCMFHKLRKSWVFYLFWMGMILCLCVSV